MSPNLHPTFDPPLGANPSSPPKRETNPQAFSPPSLYIKPQKSYAQQSQRRSMGALTGKQWISPEAGDAAAWWVAVGLAAMMMLCWMPESSPAAAEEAVVESSLQRGCEEIYVVGEEETLQSISDRCGDPFIVEENPHIHDYDDVYPGQVLKITPSKLR
ncbi:hypothetical protein AXF42_Ash014529 [Apostasia shenzhenica]|uniref:LysM domain-containing protein n=1 Tax=Apostasia shenzhenica TaxID=1088818 RepID=A0A2H9ZWV8_9ASPA|nr:hypothetical protein AXF42_Ash014529 [Apostasia shenzhenica]